MTRVGVLHTVPALVPVFDQLLSAHRDDLDIVHVADASLLSRAIAHGVTDDVRTSLRDHLAALRSAGAEAVLVTCSSIGEAAVEAAASVGVPLRRIDAPMATEAATRAVAGSGRILVLATLEATLGPTTRLVEAAAAEASRAVSVESLVVEGAAAARGGGDTEAHDALIAAAITEAGDVDAIVLAQASMASGANHDPRVLTSPESGAVAFVEALQR
ncbi:aspartate/glutamate racemase family protein [Microbacterium sp.]|uniref:aspartate/glutamate racemase family protein n=1 Tax=Microbacterium sp. TaxID=51671 RepID=UPI002734D2C6|nr:aspartate/glutamate racemase family protein [Microbacterium sp.]MDP3952669.1 aspartate/glutamate racemase family protein [Microbacterium sp.]